MITMKPVTTLKPVETKCDEMEWAVIQNKQKVPSGKHLPERVVALFGNCGLAEVFRDAMNGRWNGDHFSIRKIGIEYD